MADVTDTRNDINGGQQTPSLRGRPGRLPPEESAKITRRITAMAVIIGIILIAAKFFIWQESGSVGILSSLVHSSLDLFGAMSSFFAVRYAARPPDDNYRFGHGKSESFAAVFQVCLIVFASFHLLEEAFERFNDPSPIQHGGFAITAMLFCIAITLWLLIAQTWAIRSTGSIAVRGDRAHYLADMLANVVVISGLVLTSYTPFLRADSLVGVIIALWLLWTGYKVARLAWSQLMDRELPDTERNFIRDLALKDSQVKAVHDLRTRASGPHIHIQMRLDLDETLTLSQAHDVILAAEQRVMGAYKAADILIHPHPTGCEHTHGNKRFRSGNN